MVPDGWGGCDGCASRMPGITDRCAPRVSRARTTAEKTVPPRRVAGLFRNGSVTYPPPSGSYAVPAARRWQMVQREQVRASDGDRQVAADRLRSAHDEGRLDFSEYDRRLAAAYGAVTYADLDQLFRDLPGPAAPPPPYPPLYPPPYPPPRVPYGFGSMPGPPAYARHPQPAGPAGQVRSTGLQILLFVVTFGIWGFVYYFQTLEEMRRHTGQGIGGVIALLLSLFVGIASPFLLSHEVGGLYERSGRRRPVSALTGLWFFPGMILLVGPLIWFIQTNSALNDYWRSLGAR